MIYKPQIPWTCLELLITSICNKQCENCCYRIPKHETLNPEYYSWDIFEKTAETFYGIKKLYVSGGEPTLHPDFKKISKEFKKIFNTNYMVLVTNGAKLIENKDCIDYYNYIWITNFNDKFTQDAIKYMKDNFKNKIILGYSEHKILTNIGAGGRCSRYGIIASAGNKVFPCCIGPGLINAKYTNISKNTLKELKLLDVPCNECAFSV